MKFVHATDFSGTGLQGQVTVTYEKLVRCFGEPTCTYDDGKVQAQWCLRFADGTMATIYDWKAGDAYCGSGRGKPVEKITDWHIGGYSEYAVTRVREYLIVGR